jgi:predicted DNA-binding transcriptional regulator AlpA
MSEEMLTSRQVAEMCGVSLNTLQKWRSRNVGPKYVKFSGSNASAVRYPRADVERFINARVIPTTN